MSALGFLEHFVHFARRQVVENMGVITYQFLDAFLVFFGGFFHAGADDLQADFLQSGHHRPRFHAASEQQHALACEAFAVTVQSFPGARLFAVDQYFGASSTSLPAHRVAPTSLAIWRRESLVSEMP